MFPASTTHCSGEHTVLPTVGVIFHVMVLFFSLDVSFFTLLISCRNHGGVGGGWDRRTRRDATHDSYRAMQEERTHDICYAHGKSGSSTSKMTTFMKHVSLCV